MLLVQVRHAEALQLVAELPQAPLEVVLVEQAALAMQELELLPFVGVALARDERIELELRVFRRCVSGRSGWLGSGRTRGGVRVHARGDRKLD